MRAPGSLLARARWFFRGRRPSRGGGDRASGARVHDGRAAPGGRVARPSVALLELGSPLQAQGRAVAGAGRTRGAAVFAVGVDAFVPLAALAVVYSGLTFRSLYGGVRGAARGDRARSTRRVRTLLRGSPYDPHQLRGLPRRHRFPPRGFLHEEADVDNGRKVELPGAPPRLRGTRSAWEKLDDVKAA